VCRDDVREFFRKRLDERAVLDTDADAMDLS